jgi:tripartite-type tricarboxylate transporter receptor subunit TctC
MCCASLVALAWTGASHPAAAEDVSFAGKTITMTVGFASGGGVDLFGRMLGRHLAPHLPGHPSLVVINQLGAAGVVALNDWANKAERNGLAVTLGAQSQIDPEAVLRTHAKYDPKTFEYVGGLAAPSQGLFISKEALPRLHDKSKKPVIIGVVGTTLRTGSYQALWGAAFLGWNIKWVRGYTRTSELRQAMERGEIDMTSFGSIRDIEYLNKTGKFTVIAQSGGGRALHRPALGKAPTIAELVEGKIKDPLAKEAFDYGQNVSQIGFWLALPPKAPQAVVATYVKAFDATLKDPKYDAEVDKLAPDSPGASRQELIALVNELGKVSPKTLDFIRDELKKQGFGTAK